jgi:two-component system, response regulator PdtaR
VGHEVLETATADEALAVLRSIVSVDIVVTDVEMPGSMNGLELTAHLRAGAPSLPVIIVSGTQIPQDYAYASAFFPKPYDLDQIAARINALVPPNLNDPPLQKKANRP